VRLTPDGQERLPDLFRFGRHLVSSRDIDPLYPVLHDIHRTQGMEPQQALWHSFLYVAWYHLPSAMAAYECSPLPGRWLVRHLDASWPTGIERRNNRGGRVADHIRSFLEATRRTQLWDWFSDGLDMESFTPEGRIQNWRILNERLQTIHGNGRWAAYKHLEVLRRVHNFPVWAPDMGNQFSSGPREGLAMLYGDIEGQTSRVIAKLDRQGVDLQRRLAKHGLVVDIEELETILCNWKSLVKGKYYVGHDIDELQEQCERAVAAGVIDPGQFELIMQARYFTLPRQYLGEVNGWVGVQRKRMTAYRDQGRILTRRMS